MKNRVGDRTDAGKSEEEDKGKEEERESLGFLITEKAKVVPIVVEKTRVVGMEAETEESYDVVRFRGGEGVEQGR